MALTAHCWQRSAILSSPGLPPERPIGSIDLFSDSTDLLEGVNWRPALRQLYE